MNKWVLFHKWWKDKVNTPICPQDESPLLPGIDDNDDPLLRCLICKTKVSLGSKFYETGGFDD